MRDLISEGIQLEKEGQEGKEETKEETEGCGMRIQKYIRRL